MTRELSYLRLLETEAVFVTREVAAAKGLYRRARAGTLHGLTGVDDPYEPPPEPDLVLDGTQPIEDGVAALETLLGERGLP
jgi:adenylylsulfate kinase-like enzyme